MDVKVVPYGPSGKHRQSPMKSGTAHQMVRTAISS